MKVLLLSPLPPPAGGIASWTKRYLQTPYAKKNEIYIVNTAVAGNRVNQLNRVNLIDEINRTRNIIKNVKKQLQEIHPHIVHLNTPCSKLGLVRDYLCARIVKRTNAKLILHCHCDVTHMVNSKLGLFFYKKLVEIADRVITLNTPSKNFTLANSGKHSVIIPNFISDDAWSGLNDDQPISDSVSNIVYVGHITKLKGCDVLLEVAKYFPHIQFSLIGYIGEDIAKLDKPKNVTFTGEVSKEEVIEKMRKSDLFVFPTLTEGFPNALLEAMTCGLPIISTDVGAIPDMIEDDGGLIVQVGDITGFINKIKILENDKNLRRAMSRWNKNKVSNYYTENKVMNSLFEKYNETLGINLYEKNKQANIL